MNDSMALEKVDLVSLTFWRFLKRSQLASRLDLGENVAVIFLDFYQSLWQGSTPECDIDTWKSWIYCQN